MGETDVSCFLATNSPKKQRVYFDLLKKAVHLKKIK